jgi:drug/metabolite transporter (DMT)-like permease
MPKALLFAGIAATGNALFVYGQRRANIANNPFIFTAGAVVVCSILFAAVAIVFRTEQDINYLSTNLPSIVASGVGFLITSIGFYLLYSQYGAVYYVVYAVLSMITTSIGVGIVIFREPFNQYQIGALILAVLAVVMFGYGQTLAQ